VTPDDGPIRRFAVSLDFVGTDAVVSVRGDFDVAALSEVGPLFDVLVSNGYPSVVMDLVDLDSVAPPGLAFLADMARRLAEDGRQLSVRSASAVIQRSLAEAGLADLIGHERFELMPGHSGRRLNVSDPWPVGMANRDLAAHAERINAVPVTNDLVDSTLRLVVELARATVGGADGVSVSLRRHGRLSTVASSDQTVLDMDAQQYTTGEGPCVEASIKGHWYLAESLQSEERWPEFTPRAQALGINAILSTPLLAWKRPVGALNIYSRTASAFAARDQKLASKFAAEVSTILTETGVDVSDDQRSERFQKALRSREVIAQAQGVIMEREGIDEREAYKVLRVYSQRTGRSLQSRAEEITASTLSRQPEFGPGQDHVPRDSEHRD
jgi:anti-anti-sigma factor